MSDIGTFSGMPVFDVIKEVKSTMYQPSFNSVLVEIDDKDAEWGGENNENMLGKSYSKGTVIDIGRPLATAAYPDVQEECVPRGAKIMWNEGTEAGTTFEFEGKLYGFIYWFDIRGVK